MENFDFLSATGNRVLRFRVSYQLLRDAMKIPEHVRLITVVPGEFRACNFIVSSKEFPEVETGNLIPEVMPVITDRRHEGEDITWDWKIEEIEEADEASILREAITYMDLSKLDRSELEELKKLDWYSSGTLGKEAWQLIRTVEYLMDKLDKIVESAEEL